MKQLLLVFSVVALVGCGKKAIIADPIVEKAVRQQLNAQGDKPTGELTKADLEKVTGLDCSYIQLTSVKGLEKLTKLQMLWLHSNKLTGMPKGLEKLTKLTVLHLDGNKLTEVPKGLEKLTQLKVLYLSNNPALTKAQIAELKKALPNCKIYSTAKE